jgi:hypothetical protein
MTLVPPPSLQRALELVNARLKQRLGDTEATLASLKVRRWRLIGYFPILNNPQGAQRDGPGAAQSCCGALLWYRPGLCECRFRIGYIGL